MKAYEEAKKYLEHLRALRRSASILDAGYDWLSIEIAELERELYGRAIF